LQEPRDPLLKVVLIGLIFLGINELNWLSKAPMSAYALEPKLQGCWITIKVVLKVHIG
jgi:hypothetical protein